MVTSKYCKFGYANVWNYFKNMLQLTPALLCAPAPQHVWYAEH